MSRALDAHGRGLLRGVTHEAGATAGQLAVPGHRVHGVGRGVQTDVSPAGADVALECGELGDLIPDASAVDPSEQAHESLQRDRLRQALDTLGPDERAVFVLRDVFGFDYDEIASAVGKSAAAVRQMAHRGELPGVSKSSW